MHGAIRRVDERCDLDGLRKKIGRLLPVMMVVSAAFVMVYLSHYLKMPQIVLPTFGALLTGTWLVRDNLWHYNKRRLMISLPLAACVGLTLSILLSSHDYFYVYPSIYVAFLITSAVLVVGRTQIYPCFGAATLPILFQTTSWWYVVAVFIMVSVLCIGRSILERLRILPALNPSGFHDLPEHRHERAIYYVQMSFGLLPTLVFVPLFGDHYLLVPPLFVTYASFCNQHSSFTSHPIQTWIQLSGAFFIGTVFCCVVERLGEGLSSDESALLYGLGAGASALVMVCVGRGFHRLFPPAMSLALTPFLIHFYAPCLIYVPCMASYFIVMAWLMRTHPAYRNKDLHYM